MKQADPAVLAPTSSGVERAQTTQNYRWRNAADKAYMGKQPEKRGVIGEKAYKGDNGKDIEDTTPIVYGGQAYNSPASNQKPSLDSGGASPTDSALSMCLDPRPVAQRIVDILEGFGLLKEDADGTIPNITQLLQLAEQAFKDAIKAQDVPGILKADMAEQVLNTAQTKDNEAAAQVFNMLREGFEQAGIEIEKSQINLLQPLKAMDAQDAMDMLKALQLLKTEKPADETIAPAPQQQLEQQVISDKMVMDADLTDAGKLEQAISPILPEEVKEAIWAYAMEQDDSLENINSQDTATEDTKAMPQSKSMLALLQDAVASIKQKGGEEAFTGTDNETVKLNGKEQESSTAHIGGQKNPPKIFADTLETNQPVSTVSAQDVAQNVSNIIETISINAMEGANEFEVQLKPEFLGKLAVKLTMDADGIRAHIKAADPSAKALIQSQLPALEAQLKDKGIEIKQIEVAYEAPSFDLNHQSGAQNRYFSKAKPTRAVISIKEPEALGSIMEVTGGLDMYTETSSMEFHA